MIVDDSPDIRATVSDVFVDEGCEVTVFAGSAPALEHLRSGAPLPNLILVDLLMASGDAGLFLQERNADPALARIPVALLTASQTDSGEGADVVLQMPVQLEDLRRLLGWASAQR
jgi:CheY-like chemotaxis protein